MISPLGFGTSTSVSSVREAGSMAPAVRTTLPAKRAVHEFRDVQLGGNAGLACRCRTVSGTFT